MKIETPLKLLLATLFFICLLDMPYGYYQLVRMVALIGFSVLAYPSYKTDNVEIAILYVGLAILFQPLIKIPLGRMMWNIVDVIVGVGLIISIFIKQKNNTKSGI